MTQLVRYILIQLLLGTHVVTDAVLMFSFKAKLYLSEIGNFKDYEDKGREKPRGYYINLLSEKKKQSKKKKGALSSYCFLSIASTTTVL